LLMSFFTYSLLFQLIPISFRYMVPKICSFVAWA